MLTYLRSLISQCHSEVAYLPWTFSHLIQPSSRKYLHCSSLIYPSPNLSFYHYISAFGFCSLARLHVPFSFTLFFLSIAELFTSVLALILRSHKPSQYQWARVRICFFYRFESLSIYFASLRFNLSKFHFRNPKKVYYDETTIAEYQHLLRVTHTFCTFVELIEVERKSNLAPNFSINSQISSDSSSSIYNQKICLVLSKFHREGTNAGFGKITLDCLASALDIPCKSLIISLHPRQLYVPSEIINLIDKSSIGNVRLVVTTDYTTTDSSIYLFDISTSCITVPRQLEYSRPSFLFYPNPFHLLAIKFLPSHVDIEKFLPIQYDFTSPRIHKKFLPYYLNPHPF